MTPIKLLNNNIDNTIKSSILIIKGDNEMKIIKKYRFYKLHSDGGHSWLAVKRTELIEMGVLDKVTTFSYQKGKTVYLEEDCDLPLFVNALKTKDITYTFNESYRNNSPIRNYEHFNLTFNEIGLYRWIIK